MTDAALQQAFLPDYRAAGYSKPGAVVRQSFEDYWRQQLAGQGGISNAKPTLGERLTGYVSGGLQQMGLDQRSANRLGGKLATVVEALTPVGDATGGWQAGQDLRQGNLLSGGLGALATLLPGAAKGMFGRAFHGSPNALKIDRLRPSAGGELGRGVYFTLDRDLARGYAIPSGEDAITPHMGVLDLDLGDLNIKQIKRDEWLAERSRLMDSIRADNGGEWRGEFYDQSMGRLEDQFKQAGHHGIYDDWRQGVIFPDFADQIRILGKAPR